MKRAIINLVTPGRYEVGQKRLIETIREHGNFDGDVLTWVGEDKVGARLHHVSPYGFKVFAFFEALRQGYEQILWVDASVYCIADVTPVFDHIDKHGYIMQEAGHMVGTWTNDKTLKHFALTRDQAMQMPMYGNAGFLGLNFNDQRALEFLERWAAAERADMFKGQWHNKANTESLDKRCEGHRHDMCCGSIIAHRLGMEFQKGDEWLQYKSPTETPMNDTIIFGAQGV